MATEGGGSIYKRDATSAKVPYGLIFFGGKSGGQIVFKQAVQLIENRSDTSFMSVLQLQHLQDSQKLEPRDTGEPLTFQRLPGGLHENLPEGCLWRWCHYTYRFILHRVRKRQ